MGVRRALGAQDHDVVLLVLGQAAGLVWVGLAGGIALGFTGSRLLRSLLYGIEPTDPLVFGLVPVLLVLVCVVASWAPAYRAVRIDVAAALRYE
jgi:ABC-type antimicrobial peptide transport system permease subunit